MSNVLNLINVCKYEIIHHSSLQIRSGSCVVLRASDLATSFIFRMYQDGIFIAFCSNLNDIHND